MYFLTKLQNLFEFLFRTKIYDLSLRAEEVEPRFSIPVSFPGDADRGRKFLISDLVRKFNAVSSWQYDGLLGLQKLNYIHRFSWLGDLYAISNQIAVEVAKELTLRWIAKFDQWNTVTWSINILEERLGNWLTYYSFLLTGADTKFRHAFIRSMSRQILHLRRTSRLRILYRDGFTGVKIEIFYSIIFDSRLFRLEDSFSKLFRAIKNEILLDGGHRSRNPSLHMKALGNLVEIREVVSASNQQIPEWLNIAIASMTALLKTFRLGDGRLCLFNGSVLESREKIRRLLRITNARGRSIVNCEQTGFQRLVAGQAIVIIDTNVPNPTGEHENAGSLAFEFSNGRYRIIVNCGTPDETLSSFREACRSSAAHSTVILSNTNSSELAGLVSMGTRRARRTKIRRHEIGKDTIVEAEHDGYLALFGISHKRVLSLGSDGFDFQGQDILTGKNSTSGVARFHLHPDVDSSLVYDEKSVLLRVGKNQGWRFTSSGGKITLEESVYFGDGWKRTAFQIVVHLIHNPPASSIQWQFKRER